MHHPLSHRSAMSLCRHMYIFGLWCRTTATSDLKVPAEILKGRPAFPSNSIYFLKHCIPHKVIIRNFYRFSRAFLLCTCVQLLWKYKMKQSSDIKFIAHFSCLHIFSKMKGIRLFKTQPLLQAWVPFFGLAKQMMVQTFWESRMEREMMCQGYPRDGIHIEDTLSRAQCEV